MEAFVQIGATRDSSAPYLAAARKRGMCAILVETPDYLEYRKALDAPRFDRAIAVQKPEAADAVIGALEEVSNIRIVLPGFERYVESSFAVSRFFEHQAAPDTLPTNKYQQRRSLLNAEVDVAQPSFFLTDLELNQNAGELAAVKMPVVVKPVDGGGGLGVYLVKNTDDLEIAVQNLRSLRNYGGAKFSKLIVEECVTGAEISLQGIARNGAADLLSLCEKQIDVQYDAASQTWGFRELGHVIRNEEHFDKYLSSVSYTHLTLPTKA